MLNNVSPKASAACITFHFVGTLVNAYYRFKLFKITAYQFRIILDHRWCFKLMREFAKNMDGLGSIHT